jgi:DNA-binding transcriptional LysR family regulator
LLDAIRVFIKVAELGSFSQAGKALHMAPSSIARQVDSLEKDLQATLLKRSTRQLTLTDQGMKLLSEAETLIAHSERVENLFREDQSTLSGTLVVSSFESLGRTKICPLLPEFLERYPDIHLDFQLENRMSDLYSENVDIGIRIRLPQDSTLKARKLFGKKSVLIAGAQYSEKLSLPETPEEVAEHNCVIVGDHKQRNYWYFKRGDENLRVQIQGNISSKGSTPLMPLVNSGNALAIMPMWMVEEGINTGDLIQVLPDWQCTISKESDLDVYAVYLNTRFIKPQVRAFLDFLAEKFPIPDE